MEVQLTVEQAGVERGIAAAERGEFIEEEEMDARVERMFQRRSE